jgi:hypothetical protein
MDITMKYPGLLQKGDTIGICAPSSGVTGNDNSEDRYLTFFYKTTDYSGDLLDSTEEGNVFWTSIDDLMKMQLAPNFKEYLQMFLEDKYSEAYCAWNEGMKPDKSKDNPWGIIYR